MGERDVVDQPDPVALADSEGGRAPFADAVEGEDGRPFERAGEEGAGGVGLVVVGEDQAGARRRRRGLRGWSAACAACP